MDRPFVDRPVEDLAAATVAAERAARELGLDAPHLLRRGMNAIFAAGDVVVRVGRPIAPAALSIELAERLLAAGVRVAAPATAEVLEDGTHAVTVWERLRPSGAGIDWRAVGATVRRVHELASGVVPDGYPAPPPAAFPWWDFPALLSETADRIDGRARRGLEAAVERRRGWDRFDGSVVCHGDVHPGNVVMTDDGPVVIDWDLVCRAPRGWDHGPLMTWQERWGGAPGTYEAFAAGYGWSARGDRAAEAFAELRLVAATLMRVKAAAGGDAGAGAEAERRLRYWRGDPTAPPWHAQ